MSYTNVHVNISENQQQKLKHAVDAKSREHSSWLRRFVWK